MEVEIYQEPTGDFYSNFTIKDKFESIPIPLFDNALFRLADFLPK